MKHSPRISLIAAHAENMAIGKDNSLLWHIPEDFKWFKTHTKGHPVIMGRKTFESIGRPLPDRLNIIITSQDTYKQDGCIIAHSLPDALTIAADNDSEEVFIIGGASLFKEGLDYADRLYITIVHKEYEGDTFFPAYPAFKKEVFKQKSKNNELTYTFYIFEKEGNY